MITYAGDLGKQSAPPISLRSDLRYLLSATSSAGDPFGLPTHSDSSSVRLQIGPEQAVEHQWMLQSQWEYLLRQRSSSQMVSLLAPYNRLGNNEDPDDHANYHETSANARMFKRDQNGNILPESILGKVAAKHYRFQVAMVQF